MMDLRTLKVDELKDIARSYSIVGAWKKTKDQLIADILKNAEGNGHADRYYDSAAEATQNEAEVVQEEAEEVSDEVIAEESEESQNEPEPTKNNGWELIAKENIKNAYNWLVGERENSVSDGEMTEEEFNEWIQNEAFDEVYHEAITTKYHEGACGGKAPSEMRFAGKDFCTAYINELFKADGYELTQKETEDKPQKKQRGKDLIEYNGKTQNLSQWAKELGMPGQTLFARIRLSGWTVEKAFTTPVKTRKKKEEA